MALGSLSLARAANSARLCRRVWWESCALRARGSVFHDEQRNTEADVAERATAADAGRGGVLSAVEVVRNEGRVLSREHFAVQFDRGVFTVARGGHRELQRVSAADSEAG